MTEISGQMTGKASQSVKDRLAGYIHWQSRANVDQAVLICQRQRKRVDLDAVRVWCSGEGDEAAFKELVQRLDEDAEAI